MGNKLYTTKELLLEYGVDRRYISNIFSIMFSKGITNSSRLINKPSKKLLQAMSEDLGDSLEGIYKGKRLWAVEAMAYVRSIRPRIKIGSRETRLLNSLGDELQKATVSAEYMIDLASCGICYSDMVDTIYENKNELFKEYRTWEYINFYKGFPSVDSDVKAMEWYSCLNLEEGKVWKT